MVGLKSKQFEKAGKLFSDLMAENQNNPEYFFYQGEVFQDLNQLESSIIAFKKAVSIDSTHLRSLFQLGKYYVVRQEKNEAFLYIDKGLEFYESDISLINLKALALYNNNEYEKSIPFFERLIALGEEKKHIYTKLADAYFKEWEFEKAKAIYAILLSIDDKNKDAYFNLARVYSKNKQIDSAIYYVKKSIEVQVVTFEKEYSMLAGIYRSEDNIELSLKYYQLAFKENPSSQRNYYQICTLIDQTHKDPKVKLDYYENFIKKFGKDKSFFSDIVLKRISELKEEIHFATD